MFNCSDNGSTGRTVRRSIGHGCGDYLGTNTRSRRRRRKNVRQMLDSTNRSDGTRSRRIGMRLVLLLPFDVLMMNLARRGDQSVDGRYFCGPGRRSSCSQNKYQIIDRSIPNYKPIKAFYLWAESNCWNNSKRRPSRGCAELRL